MQQPPMNIDQDWRLTNLHVHPIRVYAAAARVANGDVYASEGTWDVASDLGAPRSIT